MHGIIHLELKKYIETRHGQASWPKLLEKAGISTKFDYVRVGQYPDEEMAAIIAAAAQGTGISAEAILEDFGEFVAPDLIGMYRRLIRREWRTLDVLSNAEQTIHDVVRARNPGAHPPMLRCARPAPDEVVITYTSPRRLCALARGIIRGIARHYVERVEIREDTCMHRGDKSCTLSVRKQNQAS